MIRRWTVVAWLGFWFSATLFATDSVAQDWPQFRGPDAGGLCPDAQPPVTWSESENLKWKSELPGPGLSSPIVVGDQVLVTCYTGYGVNAENPGAMESLQRHLVCIDRKDGKILWKSDVAATMPEDPYQGFITEHGYASHTPASDGERVYAFFGKSGVVAFDMQGKQVWQTGVGKESGQMRWGSAASPILYKQLVIVNASDESEALVALDKATGKEVWRAEAAGLASTWGTPILVATSKGTELVIAIPGEVWGLNPETGKLVWYATGSDGRAICATLVAGDGVVYCVGGNPSGSSIAVRTGGEGELGDSALVWKQRFLANISSPVLFAGHLYGVGRGIAYCVKADSGDTVYRVRLATGEAATEADGPPPGGRPGFGGGGPGGFGGGPPGGGPPGGRRGMGGMGRGGAGGQDYASPVLAGGRIYYVTRPGLVYVVAAQPEFKLLAKNQFPGDDSGFSATPAISGNALYVRSNKYLYCVSSD